MEGRGRSAGPCSPGTGGFGKPPFEPCLTDAPVITRLPQRRAVGLKTETGRPDEEPRDP